MAEEVKNIGASVRARLLNISREKGLLFELVLTRYAVERLLYRLANSPHADRLVLICYLDQHYIARVALDQRRDVAVP
ncbi:MAG: hypothetical protein RIE24_22760 [Silicimonas sp.]|jgi:hypothetical protein